MLGKDRFSVFSLMKKEDSAVAVVLGVTAIVVLAVAGLGVYVYKNPDSILDRGRDRDRNNTALYPQNQSTGTSTIAYVATSTATSTATSSGSTSYEPRRTTTTARRQTATAYQSVYGSYPYGITVPAGYAASLAVQGVYGGVMPTASYNFFRSGAYAFTVNVWSKEQWNNIRIQETINAKEGTGPDYLGEGRYLGENKTWIFSYMGGAYIPTSAGMY